MFTNFFEIWKHECIAPMVLNMVTSFSNSEPRKSVKSCVMYRTCGDQHVYKFLRNLETRMYRIFDAQNVYEPIGLENRASEIFDFVSMLKTRSV